MTRLFLAAAVAALAAAPLAAQAQTAATSALAPAAAKPVVVNGDLVDTLKLNGQFTIFTKGLTDTNLAGLLKTNGNLTVFAPTDAGFQTLPPAELAKLQTDKTAMQRFILHHVINAPVPSAKIKGTRGPWPTGAQDQVVLDGSEETAIKADGATIVQADLKTGSGLLHVVDRPLIAGSVPAALPTEAAAAPTAPAEAAAKQ
jgi:uncharacterized surface protein with fasciclin (FAS1) repeats